MPSRRRERNNKGHDERQPMSSCLGSHQHDEGCLREHFCYRHDTPKGLKERPISPPQHDGISNPRDHQDQHQRFLLGLLLILSIWRHCPLVESYAIVHIPAIVHRRQETILSHSALKPLESPPDADDKLERRNQRWVVVVDDEEDIRLAVGDYMYDQGYHVTACSDAESLLDLCDRALVEQKRLEEQRQERFAGDDGTNGDNDAGRKAVEAASRLPDAIVSDVRMPGGKNGVELVKSIRSHPSPVLSKVPLVLLTAKAMTQDRIEGYRAGADVYLPKPFAPEELLSIVDNLIDRREQRASATHSSTTTDNNNINNNPAREAITDAHIPDLLALKREMEDIKEIMKRNAANVVQKTDVYLTDAEREVLELVCDGYTNAEIAAARNVGVITVNRMITKLYEETQTRTRTGLVKWAVSTGYVAG